jgi:hypothetical protein
MNRHLRVRLHPFTQSCLTAAVAEPLERRLLLSSMTLKNGDLIVDGTEEGDQIDIRGDTRRASKVLVSVNRISQKFDGRAIISMRVYGLGGDDLITIEAGLYKNQFYRMPTPSLRQVLLDGGPGNDKISEQMSNVYSAFAAVTILGGGGDDSWLYGTKHTVVMDGGDGNDSIDCRNNDAMVMGGAGDDTVRASGARDRLLGGDGNDLLTSSFEDSVHPMSDDCSLDGGSGNDTLSGDGEHDTLSGGDGNDVLVPARFPVGFTSGVLTRAGSVSSARLEGGPGDDVLIGNFARDASRQVTLSGGLGDDTLNAFGNDAILDAGNGHDVVLGGDQFTGAPTFQQTAVLKLKVYMFNQGPRPVQMPAGIGFNEPNSPIYLSDANGTLTMRGETGDTFTVGQFLADAGYPIGQVAFPGTLSANGVFQKDIAGYVIHDGDQLELSVQAFQ